MATFGERLRSLRKGKKLTQAELADMAGVTKYTVSIWEQNHRKPEFTTLDVLCNIFDCSLVYLLGESDDDTPPMPAGIEKEPDWMDGDDLEAMRQAARLLTRLSHNSKMMICASIAQAYKLDQNDGNLQLGYDVKMSRFERGMEETEKREAEKGEAGKGETERKPPEGKVPESKVEKRPTEKKSVGKKSDGKKGSEEASAEMQKGKNLIWKESIWKKQ